VQIKLAKTQSPTHATIRPIDHDHANAKQRRQEMGTLEYLTAGAVAELNAASRCEPEPQPFGVQEGMPGIDATLPQLSVAAVSFRF